MSERNMYDPNSDLCAKLRENKDKSPDAVLDKMREYVQDTLFTALEILLIKYDFQLAGLQAQLNNIKEEISNKSFNTATPPLTINSSPAGFNPPPKSNTSTSIQGGFKGELERRVAQQRLKNGND